MHLDVILSYHSLMIPIVCLPDMSKILVGRNSLSVVFVGVYPSKIKVGCVSLGSLGVLGGTELEESDVIGIYNGNK